MMLISALSKIHLVFNFADGLGSIMLINTLVSLKYMAYFVI